MSAEGSSKQTGTRTEMVAERTVDISHQSVLARARRNAELLERSSYRPMTHSSARNEVLAIARMHQSAVERAKQERAKHDLHMGGYDAMRFKHGTHFVPHQPQDDHRYYKRADQQRKTS